jgi:hypothetical protein
MNKRVRVIRVSNKVEYATSNRQLNRYFSLWSARGKKELDYEIYQSKQSSFSS